MSNVPPNVGVFFGKADKRSEGWYWVEASTNAPKGPFETKAQAIENAVLCVSTAEEHSLKSWRKLMTIKGW
jgi:hypothetical protein